MVKIGSNSPLTISEDAQEIIESMRIAKKFAKNDYLRVKASIPTINNDSVTFNMYFDNAPEDSDMAYIQGKTKILLDTQTAHLLVGSELFQTPEGDLAFNHLDTTSCFDCNDQPIKN